MDVEWKMKRYLDVEEVVAILMKLNLMTLKIQNSSFNILIPFLCAFDDAG
jgi:hypothetical protein